MRRILLLGLVVALVGAAVPSVAAAESCPAFDGVMIFPTIQGPEDPEDYCWEVQLFEGQELRQIDETHAEVFYTEPEHQAFGITAELARDAVGTEVPTSLEVIQPNLIVLTVHHRASNPAAERAPFDYPITSGPGWEGGFESVEIKGPPDESELKKQPAPLVARRAVSHLQCPRPTGPYPEGRPPRSGPRRLPSRSGSRPASARRQSRQAVPALRGSAAGRNRSRRQAART